MPAPLLLLSCLTAVAPAAGGDEVTATLSLREHPQKVRLVGPASGPPAIVASGDGGWVHLGPDVAARLGTRGYHVVGFDSKSYLSSFTDGSRTLSLPDVRRDFAALVEYARGGRDARVLLVGVSEGAGLSVVAASDPTLQPCVLGIVALGLPRVNELGWRFRDSVIYLTHGKPKEPTFDSGDYIRRLGPVPLAALHSTHDEFVPLPEIQALLDGPGGARRLWVIEAANHRFSDDHGELDRRLTEALDWVRTERR